MVESGARRLLLLGRTALPARHLWDKAQGNRDRERIAAIRKNGSAGRVRAGRRRRHHRRRATARHLGRIAADGWPPVAGIIQCAGVLQGRLVGDGNDQDFEAVWRPKAQGTRNLDAVTAGRPLDFFVVFSSMASFLPSAGQASYAAANCFLDAFAADARAAGRRVIAVNWGPWADVGMAAELSTRGALGVSSRGFESLAAGQALTALSRVLAAPAYAQTAIMAFDWRQWTRATAPLPLFADLAATDSARSDARSTGEPAATLQAQVAAASTALERRTIIEGLLREQVAQVLKRSPATIELVKPFRAMGLDSLMALEFRNRLEALAGVRLPATLAFNYPTIAALAPFLASKAGIDLTEAEPAAAAGPLDEPADDVERLLAEIEQLSDADVRRLTLEEK